MSGSGSRRLASSTPKARSSCASCCPTGTLPALRQVSSCYTAPPGSPRSPDDRRRTADLTALAARVRVQRGGLAVQVFGKDFGEDAFCVRELFCVLGILVCGGTGSERLP